MTLWSASTARYPRAMAAPAKTSRSRSRAKAAVERRIVVALDGPASSGKSSVGAAAAGRLGLRFVDTGLLYRALTAAALREGIATDDAAGLVALADRVTLGDDGTGRLTTVLARRHRHDRGARGPERRCRGVGRLEAGRGARRPPAAPARARRGRRDRRRGPRHRDGRAARCRPQAVPRRLGGGAGGAADRGARPGPGRRRGRGRPRAAPRSATTRTATGRSPRSGPRTTP